MAAAAAVADPVRRSIDDVFDFQKIAAVFCDVVSSKHAASLWGQDVDPSILSMITVLAAPCVVSAEMYMARHSPGVSVDELLLSFEPNYRRHQWWWGNTVDKDALVDMVALDLGPRIFAGCLTTWDDSQGENQQCSEVFKYDEQGVPTWYVFALELRGGHDVCIDLMVHADSTMMDIMMFACHLFRMRQIPSTVLILWGVDEEGGVDVEDPSVGVGLSTHSTSAIMDMRFADVFAILEQVAARMEENLLEPETDDFEHHYEWRTIVKKQATLWD
jgi:hypothetical protein